MFDFFFFFFFDKLASGPKRGNSRAVCQVQPSVNVGGKWIGCGVPPGAEVVGADLTLPGQEAHECPAVEQNLPACGTQPCEPLTHDGLGPFLCVVQNICRH